MPETRTLEECLTWASQLHLDNNEPTYKHIRRLCRSCYIAGEFNASRYKLSKELREWFTSLSYDMRDKIENACEHMGDLNAIVTRTIAEHLTRSVACIEYEAMADRYMRDYIDDLTC